jgi:hypothetical protein
MAFDVKTEPIEQLMEVPLLYKPHTSGPKWEKIQDKFKQIMPAVWPQTPHMSIMPYYQESNKVLVFLNEGMSSNEEQQKGGDAKAEIENYYLYWDTDIGFTTKSRKEAVIDSEKSYVDVDLKPNVKYYFIATAMSANTVDKACWGKETHIDSAGGHWWKCAHVGKDIYRSRSPMTNIMTVEIVEDHGAIYTIIEPYEPEKVKPKNNIAFQKKLRIEPAFLQQAPNSKKFKLGFIEDTENEVWTSPTGPNSNPKFKFRITSQKTKRKIDLNVEFVLNKNTDLEKMKNEGEMILEWK